MTKLHVVTTEKAPDAIGPYSQAIATDALVFTAGQVALDPASGAVVGQTTAEQTEQVLRNLAGVLEAAGSGLGRVVKTTVFLADMADFPAMNADLSFRPNKSPHHFREHPWHHSRSVQIILRRIRP